MLRSVVHNVLMVGPPGAGKTLLARAGLPVETIPTMSGQALHRHWKDSQPLTILDVRQRNEWEAGHIPGAVHIENRRLAWDDLRLATHRPIAVHCAHRNRSVAAISVLKRRGYQNVVQVEGGFAAWVRAGGEIVSG